MNCLSSAGVAQVLDLDIFTWNNTAVTGKISKVCTPNQFRQFFIFLLILPQVEPSTRRPVVSHIL